MGSTAIKYRPDIDGLRAIAVLSVVLYHYGIGGLQGGFIGVDVFFVISGYLITGIIHKEMQQGRFTLAGFYERRARRIFPALFAMLLATLVAGWWLLLPSDLANLGQSSVATILFVSNGLYYARSGYFDPASDFNPLLHTWSLGVEEQFYLGLPLLLLLVGRFWSRGLAWVLLACTLLSFVACVVTQPVLAKAVFFMSPFRAWELLLGALLGIGAIPQIRSSALREGMALVALLTLLGSVAVMREGIDFPGWKAAIPVTAIALLLHVGCSGGSQISRALAWKPLVFAGLISYSLYLWHWPLLVLAKYRNGMAPLAPMQAWLLLAMAVVLAVASYYLVEQPFRRRGQGVATRPHGRVFVVSATAAALLCAVGMAYTSRDGFPMRVPTAVAELDRARMPVIPYQKECDGKPVSTEHAACRIGAQGNDGLALVWGDSWAIAWAPALDQVLKQEGHPGILALRSSCAPLPGVNNRKSPTCLERNAQVLDWIRQHRPERVYLVAAWAAWVNKEDGYPLEDTAAPGLSGNDRIFAVAYPRTLQAIRPYVKEIVVVGPTPGAPDALPYRMAMATWGGDAFPPAVTRAAFDEDAHAFWQVAGQPVAGVRRIDPAPWFCDPSACRYLEAGELLYRDGNHLNLVGARFVAAHLLAAGAPQVSGATETVH